MGFKKQNLVKNNNKKQQKSYKKNMQTYYSNLYDEVMQRLKSQGYQKQQIDRMLSSIFSRTKLPTRTSDITLLKLIDIDKIISLNQRSLKQNSQEIKHMRMVASIKHQVNRNGQEDNLRQINNLVRMARLHFIQVNRRQAENQNSSDEQNQINSPERFQRIRQFMNRNR